MSNYGPNENLTLTLGEIERYQDQGSGKQSGKYLRYFCPIHGGDNQRSLSLDPDTGRFQCFSCSAWGYLAEKRQERRQANHSGSSWNGYDSGGKGNSQNTSNKPRSSPLLSRVIIDEPPARPKLITPLQTFQAALPGSPGEAYLKRRGIPMGLAQKYGLGYAAPGLWPNPMKYFTQGCIVFPHTNPAGEIVNLYGRAVDLNDTLSKAHYHAHLEGPKGVFNAQALTKEKVVITEGAFDAISLLAAGYEACAIFGVNGLRWSWVKAPIIAFGFDQDQAGESCRELAGQGTLQGKEVYILDRETYVGRKDLNEAWAANGHLALGEWTETRPEKPLDIKYCPQNKAELKNPTIFSADDHGMSLLWDRMMEGDLREPIPVIVMPKFQAIMGERVWFLPEGALADTGRPELSFYRKELIEIVPLLINIPEYAKVLVMAKQVFGGVLQDSSEEESFLDPAFDHVDQGRQIQQQGDRPEKIPKTHRLEIPQEGAHLIRIEQVKGYIKKYDNYAGLCARVWMKILEGPDAGKILVDNISMEHPLETDGRRRRRLLIAYKLGLISNEDQEEKMINWKTIEGVSCLINLVHRKFNGRKYAFVDKYQLHSTIQEVEEQ